MPDIFIDKRVFVNGRKSVLHLDNPFNLTGYIIDQIYLFALTCAQNGLNIQATLHPVTGVQQNCVELGGTLLHNTIVDSGTFDLSFTNSNNLTLQANDFFYLQTPAIASASNGWILTLIDQVTGESEWSSLPAGGLLNVGLGLTESPVGTVKLGGAGIGSGENLTVLNGDIWEVNEIGAIVNVTNAINIGTDPIFGPGARLVSTITGGAGLGNIATSTVFGDGVSSSAIMYQEVGTEIRQVALIDSIVISREDPGVFKQQIVVQNATIRLTSKDTIPDHLSEILIDNDSGVQFEGRNAGVPFAYRFPFEDGLINQILVNDGGNVLEWKDQRYVQSYVPGDWTGDNLTVLASTHERGLNPLIQVFDSAGLVLIPGDSLALVGVPLDAIKVNGLGDVILTKDNGTAAYSGKIIII